jgi:hypothetical protein
MKVFANKLIEKIKVDTEKAYEESKEIHDVYKIKEFDGYSIAMRRVLKIINQLLEEEVSNKLPEGTNYYTERFNRVV